MSSSEDITRELEFKRRALNERLMNAKDVAEANAIERELWAVRARIRFHKITKEGVLRSQESQARPRARESSRESVKTNINS